MKCPMCSNGEVVVGDEITNDPILVKFYGNGAHFAVCSVCTAGGVVKDGVCHNWLVRTKNLKPITREEARLEEIGSVQNVVQQR